MAGLGFPVQGEFLRAGAVRCFLGPFFSAMEPQINLEWKRSRVDAPSGDSVSILILQPHPSSVLLLAGIPRAMPTDELLSRRPGAFREGRRVRLADGNFWTFPAPSRDAAFGANSARAELLTAIVEADDDHDRSLAELAFMVFLLRSNYDLGPAELQALLTFSPSSTAADAWRINVAQIVEEHIQAAAPLRADSASSAFESEPLARGGPFGLLSRWFGRWRLLPSSLRR